LASLKAGVDDYLAYLENGIIDLGLMVREIENEFEETQDVSVAGFSASSLISAC